VFCRARRVKGTSGASYASTEVEPRMVQTYGTNKNMNTMVWAMFWDNGEQSLYHGPRL